MESIKEIGKLIAITAGLFMLSATALAIVVSSTILLR